MLYILPTPIGNKEDITLRWLRVLKEVNYFICEDTRTTKNLMNMYEIDHSEKHFYSLTSYTDKSRIDDFINIIRNYDVCLVSEAWTPWLSDPGKELIKFIWENNLDFSVLPWANALIPTVVGSWFDTSQFIFMWFIPHKKWRQKLFSFIIESTIPVFVYESVHRVEKTLLQLKQAWFTWKVSLVRELSKMFEQKFCADIDTVIKEFESKKIPLKWEFVLWFSND